MKLVLLKPVEHLGAQGAQVDVPDGYARNFLIPRKLATPATKGMMAYANRLQAGEAKRREQEEVRLKELIEKLASVSCTVTRKASEDDKLFGSVTSADLAEVFRAQGFAIDKRQIGLEEPIKSLGVFTVPVRLSPAHETNVKVWVVRDPGEGVVAA